jgi:hypothetical protein
MAAKVIVERDVDVHVDRNCGDGCCCRPHPAAAAVTETAVATSAAVGSSFNASALPPSRAAVAVISYIVVTPPN